MGQPGKPIYTPKQLMKEGLSAGAGKFMMIMFNLGNKPGHFDMMRGGNNRSNPPVVTIDKVIQNEDGSSRIIKVPLQTKAGDVDEYLKPQYMNQIEFAEYQGPYHEYPNGAAYTGATFNDESVPLLPYTKAIEMAERIDHILAKKKKKPLDREEAQATTEVQNADQPVRSPNNTIYFKLTGKRFDRYLSPKYFYPEPTENDYEQGFMFRYFCQKINDNASIMEISKDDYDSANTDNMSGIDEGVLVLKVIEWTITGPIADARKANDRVIINAGDEMPKLVNYLTDLDEFHLYRQVYIHKVVNIYYLMDKFM